MKRFEIEAGKKFARLSKGAQRRLAFALAVATGPEMLLLDEPGVDPFARREMMAEISRCVQDGHRTVLFATHVMEEVRRVADYVAFLVDGDFLGLYEKDALLESWKTLWVDRSPSGDTPGVVDVADGRPTRLVTNSPQETASALGEREVSVIRAGPMDLEEILSHLMRYRAATGRQPFAGGNQDANAR